MINYFGGVYMNGTHQVLSFSLLIVKQKEICWVNGTLLLEGRSSAKTTIEVIIEEITWYPRSFRDFMLQDSAFFNLSHQELPTNENKEAPFYHLISQVKASKFENMSRTPKISNPLHQNEPYGWRDLESIFKSQDSQPQHNGCN